MRGTFWKVCAVLVVLLAAAYVTRPLWAPAGSRVAPYVDAGGGDNGMIAFAGLNNQQGKAYLVDTKAQVVLVYQASQSVNSFKLVAGRLWASDAAACRNNELAFNQRGYTVQQTKAIAEGGGPAPRRNR